MSHQQHQTQVDEEMLNTCEMCSSTLPCSLYFLMNAVYRVQQTKAAAADSYIHLPFSCTECTERGVFKVVFTSRILYMK